MDPVDVYSKNSEVRHLVDADKYTIVSRSRCLCGLSGKSVWIPDAVYFYGINWKLCKKCKRSQQKGR